MSKYYTIHKSFIPPIDCENFSLLSKDLISNYYTPKNLETHLAYISDKQPGRESYAFAMTTNPDHPLHSVLYYPTTLTNKRDLHTHILDLLGLSDKARVLFNIQMYYSKSSPVTPHFDGELLDFTVHSDNSLTIHEAIRPAKVAVLTLINDIPGGVGTTLHTPDGIETVTCHAGDLLIFDNYNCLHSVQEFNAIPSRSDSLIRMTIGWRSLSENCYYHNDLLSKSHDLSQQVTTTFAEYLLANWLANEWPLKYNEYLSQSHKAPF